jgi:CCR4-NOT transcriptional regulation complex NOT5 subunit
VGPASYPKSQPDVISAPGLFRKMDPEALFFAFYYQPDTYQQYLAAQVRLIVIGHSFCRHFRRERT